MKLVNKILEALNEENLLGKTTSNKSEHGNMHDHSYSVDASGNGATDENEGHSHQVSNWVVQMEHDHGHEIKRKEAFGVNEAVIKKVSASEADKLIKAGELVVRASSSSGDVAVYLGGDKVASDYADPEDINMPHLINKVRIDGFNDWKEVAKSYKRDTIYFYNKG